MENFVKLNNYYPIRIRRDAIPKYLVYSYMELWMSEEGQNGKRYTKLYEELLKDKGLAGDHRVISYWYMMQYMYAKGESDEVERGKN